MAIMVPTMAATKNIILTRAVLLGLGCCVALAAVANLYEATAYLRTYPVAVALDQKKPINKGVIAWMSSDDPYQKNLSAMALIAVSQNEPLVERLRLLAEARALQEEALAASPADPYGWLRLSYLRRVTQGNKQTAFDALRLSISTAPFEPRIQRDRAIAWAELKAVQSDEEKKAVGELWRLAKRAEKARY